MATTGEDILDRVTTVVTEITDIPKAELLPDKSLRDDLEIDSLTTIELAVTIQDEFDIEITSLADYLAMAPTDNLVRWKGELRSGCRANVLMGVASNRVDVKYAAAVTERQLERRAEPLAALFQPASSWPARLLEIAWTKVVQNAAHDSICACSVDDVVDGAVSGTVIDLGPRIVAPGYFDVHIHGGDGA